MLHIYLISIIQEIHSLIHITALFKVTTPNFWNYLNKHSLSNILLNFAIEIFLLFILFPILRLLCLIFIDPVNTEYLY